MTVGSSPAKPSWWTVEWAYFGDPAIAHTKGPVTERHRTLNRFSTPLGRHHGGVRRHRGRDRVAQCRESRNLRFDMVFRRVDTALHESDSAAWDIARWALPQRHLRL